MAVGQVEDMFLALTRWVRSAFVNVGTTRHLMPVVDVWHDLRPRSWVYLRAGIVTYKVYFGPVLPPITYCTGPVISMFRHTRYPSKLGTWMIKPCALV